jgi:glycerol-3-phosphate O-acyltransferase
MRITRTLFALGLLLPEVSNAFVMRSPSVSPPSFSVQSKQWASTTTTDEVTTPGASTISPLEPEYQQALDQLLLKLTAGIPESMKSSRMLPLLTHFATEYMAASQMAEVAMREQRTVPSNAKTDPKSAAQRFLTGVQYGLQYGLPTSPDLYTFDVSHTALDGTQEEYGGVDFYRFGCDFFRPCMDLTSVDVNVLGATTHLLQIKEQLAKGENVVLLANHQSEADPQVVSACLELAGHGDLAANMIYVAGHKVTTDPLAIPFSMGRNLICIHSKKHIDADPETKPLKQKQNLKAMNALLSHLKDGGALIWVAPSGGRDRRDVTTGQVPLAPFDSKTIDMFRLMGNKSKVPTHYYTFAMVSYDLCPPPDTIEANVGESRNVRFQPVGVAVGKELESVGGLESRQTFCHTAQEQCQKDYEQLLQLLHPKEE